MLSVFQSQNGHLTYRLIGKMNVPGVHSINRWAIMDDVAVWENIPKNVKRDLTPPPKPKHPPVIRICSKIGSAGSDCGRLVVTDGLDRQPTLLCSLFCEGAGRERTGLQCDR